VLSLHGQDPVEVQSAGRGALCIEVTHHAVSESEQIRLEEDDQEEEDVEKRQDEKIKVRGRQRQRETRGGVGVE